MVFTDYDHREREIGFKDFTKQIYFTYYNDQLNFNA